MTITRARLSKLTLLLATLVLGFTACAEPTSQGPDLDGETLPENFLIYDKKLSSAGQPDEHFFKTLANRSTQIVINIAPSTSNGSLENEGHYVSSAGMTYLNIPVDWHHPTQSEVDMFLAFMRANSEKNIFVHCQKNMRASAYAFLHRVINQRISPPEALEDMLSIWTPNATWTELINTALVAHSIDFQIPNPQE